MAKLLLGENRQFALAQGVHVFGQDGGSEAIGLQAGVSGVDLDANIERLDLADASGDVDLTVAGDGLTLQRGSTTIATVPSLNQAMNLRFTDGNVSVRQTGATEFTLEGARANTQTVETQNPANVIVPLRGETSTVGDSNHDNGSGDGGGGPTTNLFLDARENFELAQGARVFGRNSGSEAIRLQAGVSGVDLDANIERLDLTDASRDIELAVTGDGLTLQRGSTTIATVPSLNQAMELRFTDGNVSVRQTGATEFTLEGTRAKTQTVDTQTSAGVIVPLRSETSRTDGADRPQFGNDKSTLLANADSAALGQGESRNIDVLSNDRESDTDSLRILNVSEPEHGTAVNRDGTIHYIPNSDFSGADEFNYTIVNQEGRTASATVYVTVGAEGRGETLLKAETLEGFRGTGKLAYDAVRALLRATPDASFSTSSSSRESLTFDIDQSLNNDEIERLIYEALNDVNHSLPDIGNLIKNTQVVISDNTTDLAEKIAKFENSTTREEVETLRRNPGFSGVRTDAEGSFIVTLINEQNKYWLNAGEMQKKGIYIHEFFHVAQNELVGTNGVIGKKSNDEVPVGGPQWLIEGSASLASNFVQGNPILDVDMGDFDSLLAFWSSVGEGVHWRDAFLEVFEMRVGEFYASFEGIVDSSGPSSLAQNSTESISTTACKFCSNSDFDGIAG